jgi:hypothetical protein
MSPWSIRGRQNRDTSRAHPGSGRPLCAEAAETIRTKGTASKNLVKVPRHCNRGVTGKLFIDGTMLSRAFGLDLEVISDHLFEA